MALGQNDFNELLSATIQKIEKQLVDNVLTAHPTLDFLKANVKSATGPSVIFPIIAADDTSTVFTDASGTFSTAKSSDILGVAKYDWAEPLVSKVRVEFKQLEMNSGPEAVVSLAKAHLDAAVKGHGKKIATVLHTAGSAGAGAFNTLDEIISNSDKLTTTTARTVGGIRGGVGTVTITDVERDASDNTTITCGAHDFIVGDSVVVAGTTLDSGSYNGTWTITAVAATTFTYVSPGATAGTTAQSGTATVAAVKTYWRATEKSLAKSGGSAVDIRVAFRTISDDIYVASGERPNAIIAGRDVFSEYENSFDSKIQYNDVRGTGETRFRQIDFDGIPVRLDPDAPVNTAYFINTDYLVARYLASNFMKAMPSQQIVGTLDTVTPLATVLTFGTNNRRAHGKLVRV
jgi:ribosomal protein L18E